MKRLPLTLLFLAIALVVSACGDDGSRHTINENTQDLASEGVLDFDKVYEMMVEAELPDIARVPREQVGSNRSTNDPVEYLTARDNETKEDIYIGFFLTAEDAKPASDRRRNALKEGLIEEVWEMTISERICNVYFVYQPGRELFRPQMILEAQDLYVKMYSDCYGEKAAEKERARLDKLNEKLAAGGVELTLPEAKAKDATSTASEAA